MHGRKVYWGFMMKKLLCLSIALLWLLACPLVVFGDPIIQFQATNLGGNTWQYDYTVQGMFLANQGFKIYFAYDYYKKLSMPVWTQPGWDPIVIQPDDIWGVKSDGQYDALALAANDPSTIIFSVVFEWQGSGRPGSQLFDVYNYDPATDLATWSLSGYTTAKGQTVPEPGTLVLVCVGLAGALTAARRKR
jgi:hypothetical protein